MTGPAQGQTLVLALVVAFLLPVAESLFITETGRLRIEFPTDTRAVFSVALANYGQPIYGDSLTGIPVYVDSGHLESPVECSPQPCRYGCQAFSEASPPYSVPSTGGPYIMLIERGPPDSEDLGEPCTFVQKTLAAQQAGAVAVVVLNYDEQLITPSATDGKTAPSNISNITIPTVFAPLSTGNVLKRLIRDHKESPSDILISLDWNILQKRETVEWEFWMDNNDVCGYSCDLQRQFIKDMAPFAKELEADNATVFSPHYVIFECPAIASNVTSCQPECIHTGRYCAKDPENNTGTGYQGRDVVTEDLRQMCLYNISTESGRPSLWWDYAAKFWDECQIATGDFGEECAEKVFRDINGPELMNGNGLEAWRECIDFENIDADIDSEILEMEQRLQNGDGTVGSVAIIPTVRINGIQYRGTLTVTNVMRSLCDAFPRGQEPEMCNREWVSNDECIQGAVGWEECHNSTNTALGRTGCENTFVGFNCKCGEEFLTQGTADGGFECLDINECATTSIPDENPDCACERCACHNDFGGFHCEPNILNECDTDFGGCWHGIVDGKNVSACVDLLDDYKRLASAGKANSSVPLHKCECTGCLEPAGDGSCRARCKWEDCDEEKGQCLVLLSTSAAGKAGSSISGGVLAVVVISIILLVAVVGFLAYRRLRKDMRGEMDYIMTHYMPLSEDKVGPGGTLRQSDAGNEGGPLDPRGESLNLGLNTA